jgi:hypothetical protein
VAGVPLVVRVSQFDKPWSSRYWNSSHVRRDKGCDIGGLQAPSLARGLAILVVKVSVHRALSNFGVADYRETRSQPSENGVAPHRVGRINGQESPPSAGAITTKKSIKLRIVVTVF